jgi:uncharacterized membrane protein
MDQPQPLSTRGSRDTPPGWSYNPSAWRERWLLLALAAIGLLAALYTALSQLGVVGAMVDPFFGSASSYAVTHSAISRLLPVPDGVLGVVGYCCDLVFGALGGERRWRTRPWAVLLFALVILALGMVSLVLTILQGAAIDSWCTVCLISAAVSTLILGLGIGEALASLQYLALVRMKAGGAAAWRALWGAAPARARERTAPVPGVTVGR